MNEQSLLRVVSDDGYADGEYEVEVGCSVVEPDEIADLDEKIRVLNAEREDMLHRIDFLTSHADKLDILVSACSGILTAVIDALLKEKRIKDILGANATDMDLLDFLNLSGKKGYQSIECNLLCSKCKCFAQHAGFPMDTVSKINDFGRKSVKQRFFSNADGVSAFVQ